jgi:hypothetical protein
VQHAGIIECYTYIKTCLNGSAYSRITRTSIPYKATKNVAKKIKIENRKIKYLIENYLQTAWGSIKAEA